MYVTRESSEKKRVVYWYCKKKINLIACNNLCIYLLKKNTVYISFKKINLEPKAKALLD